MTAISLGALTGTDGFRLDGAAAQDQSGGSVSAAGDVNGDGIGDLIVGARYADPGGASAAGSSYVVFGTATGFAASLDLAALDGADGFRLDGAAAGDRSGSSVSAAGDVNGDGIGDLIVGADLADPNGAGNAGSSYVVFGKATGFAASLNLGVLDGTDGFRLAGVTAGDVSGVSVSAAGDVNGDGIGDLIVGAYLADPNGYASGASYVVFGKSTGFAASLNLGALDGTDGFRLDGAAAGDRSGFSVSAAGDVNGDGIADLIVGANQADPNGLGSGSSHVVFGKTTGFAASLDLGALDGTDGFRLDGAAAEDRSGRSVSGAGDVNGDGIDDLIVGALYADPGGANAAGSSYVVFGKATGFAASLNLAALDGTDGFRLDGAAAGDRSGISVSAAGDVNGDGIGDLIVGARDADPNSTDAAGSSHVVFGKTTGFAASLDLGALDGADGFRLDGAAALDYSGGAVSAAGDVNGDGIDDVIVGARGADPNGSGSGSSYVVFGFRTIDGGANRISGSLLAEEFDGLGGNDTIFGLGGNDTLTGGDGDDRLEGGPGANVIDGGADDDTAVFVGALSAYALMQDGGTVTISRAGESHTITNVESFLFADGARSLAQLFPAPPPVDPPPEDPPPEDPPADEPPAEDPPIVGPPDDEPPPDEPSPPADEPASPTRSDDALSGAGGPDRIAGRAGDDTLRGLGGEDTLLGQGGEDVLRGGGGGDSLKGGGGADRMFGQGGEDTLKGGGAGDFLKGGGAADRIIGGGGADTIEGNKGDDTLKGGGGADLFRFKPGDGDDVIQRFQQGRDQVEFKRGVSDFSELRIEQQGDDVLVTYGRGSILIENRNAGALGEDDFIF
ncbi:MAG: beta strand repeat-containing protein [Pikeienuella sp.]|uniref:beta strand repeat-containing protein n=1 Tax=Pikeienuella sp. TaxID=2831957 RepID=UPI0039187694